MDRRPACLLSCLAVVALLSPQRAGAEGPASAPLADDPTLIALAVALACADAPDAIAATPGETAPPAADGPELELVATVRAKTLRFDEVPRVDVVFRGEGKRRTTWKTERVNLPRHPEPGVVYRDVQVRLTISSDLEELASLLRQAKRASNGVRIENPVVPAAAPAVNAPSVSPPAPPALPAAPGAVAPPRAPHPSTSAPGAVPAAPPTHPAIPPAPAAPAPAFAPPPGPAAAPPPPATAAPPAAVAPAPQRPPAAAPAPAAPAARAPLVAPPLSPASVPPGAATPAPAAPPAAPAPQPRR